METSGPKTFKNSLINNQSINQINWEDPNEEDQGAYEGIDGKETVESEEKESTKQSNEQNGKEDTQREQEKEKEINQANTSNTITINEWLKNTESIIMYQNGHPVLRRIKGTHG